MYKKNIVMSVIVLSIVFLFSFTSLASTKKCIRVGESKKINLSLKGKIKWKSSNKKVVKVSSKGKITGIKKGNATIFAIKGKKKIVFKIKVKNCYYKADFKNATKMMARNLNNGETKVFYRNEIEDFQNIINTSKYYKKVSKTKKAVGDLSYTYMLYNNSNKLICSISIGYKKISVNSGKNNIDYITKINTDYKKFKF